MEQEEKMSKSRVGESLWGGMRGVRGGQLVVGHLPPKTHAQSQLTRVGGQDFGCSDFKVWAAGPFWGNQEANSIIL